MNKLNQQPHTGNIAGDPLKVLIIGAGFSGICAAIKLLEKGESNFQVFEKSSAVGGTWYANSYPGAACDVPSHFYCFSFEPNPDWSRLYSPQAEIKSYIEHCAEKYGVMRHIQFGRHIERLKLSQQEGLWQVILADGQIFRARHVINGSGGLHVPSIPDFEGRDSFSGAAMHTARWDHGVDMRDQRIGVIGSAASAIQAVPELAKVASHVSIFQRTPNYIAPRNDRAYSNKEKQRFARWPLWGRLYRWFIFMSMELLLYPITKQGSRAGRLGAKKLKNHIRATVKDSNLWEKLEPEYELGCKRILISDDYYPALNRDNVSLVTEGIERIEPHGIRSQDGALHELDVIIYATGFSIDEQLVSIELEGINGELISKRWENGAEAYKGVSIAGFPNYYMVTGPNTGVGTTSVVYMVEQQMVQILAQIDATGGDTLMGVKQSAQDSYNQKLYESLSKSVWASGCDSWYIDKNGKISTLYPYNARTFRRQSLDMNTEHFEFYPVSSNAESAI